MHWRIMVEAVDPTGEEYRQEFLFEKSLDGLTDGRIGCSVQDGKVIMAEIQKAVVQRELDLWVRYRRVCQCCGGQLPIKDYQRRNILTVFGAVPVTYPRLLICQRCNPWACFTFSPAADLCPGRATRELMELSAKLGARLSYREASNILSTFLPGDLSGKFIVGLDKPEIRPDQINQTAPLMLTSVTARLQNLILSETSLSSRCLIAFWSSVAGLA